MLSRLIRRLTIFMVSIAASIVAGRYFIDQMERDREKRQLLQDVEISTKPKPVPPAPKAVETTPTPKATSAPKTPKATVAPASAKPDTSNSTDDLTIIDGIGPAYARALNVVGIHSFTDLASQKPAELITKLQTRITIERARDWIKQAKQLSKS